jgi:hypothetical protein
MTHPTITARSNSGHYTGACLFKSVCWFQMSLPVTTIVRLLFC